MKYGNDSQLQFNKQIDAPLGRGYLMTNIPQPDFVLGKHAIIDLSGCDSEIIRNCDLIRDILIQATQIANITVLDMVEHYFKPEGYTAVLVLEESHLSIHTWPEYNYVSIDLYSCNLQTNFQAVKDFLSDKFQATVTKFTLLERGFLEISSPNDRTRDTQEAVYGAEDVLSSPVHERQ